MSETTRLIHPDFPPLNLAAKERWDHDGPLSDIASALDAANALTAEPIPDPAAVVHVHDIAEVVRYSISYHGDEWKPGESTGTELSLSLVARLTDGRWVAIEGWNDYTGWGCRDGSDVRVGASEEQVVRFGLSKDARAALGYPEVTS